MTKKNKKVLRRSRNFTRSPVSNYIFRSSKWSYWWSRKRTAIKHFSNALNYAINLPNQLKNSPAVHQFRLPKDFIQFKFHFELFFKETTFTSTFLKETNYRTCEKRDITINKVEKNRAKHKSRIVFFVFSFT